ncbi:hypothetical protein OTU49_014130, partial [Cherax quadricarinatus]
MKFPKELLLVKDKESDLLKLKCKLGNKYVSFIVDSGSDTTQVSLQTVMECGLVNRIGILSEEDAKDYKPSLIGLLDAALVCHGNVVIHTTMFVNESTPLLLGMDVLHNYHCSIRMSNTRPTLVVRPSYIDNIFMGPSPTMMCQVGQNVVKVIIDSGSTCSTMNPKIQNHLNIKVQEMEPITIINPGT